MPRPRTLLGLGALAYAAVVLATVDQSFLEEDEDWEWPVIYTGHVPAELEEIRAKVAPGYVPRYDVSQHSSGVPTDGGADLQVD